MCLLFGYSLLSLLMISRIFLVLKWHIIWFQYCTKLAISQEKHLGVISARLINIV